MAIEAVWEAGKDVRWSTALPSARMVGRRAACCFDVSSRAICSARSACRTLGWLACACSTSVPAGGRGGNLRSGGATWRGALQPPVCVPGNAKSVKVELTSCALTVKPLCGLLVPHPQSPEQPASRLHAPPRSSRSDGEQGWLMLLSVQPRGNVRVCPGKAKSPLAPQFLICLPLPSGCAYSYSSLGCLCECSTSDSNRAKKRVGEAINILYRDSLFIYIFSRI